ncbi:hypothetical protein HZS_3729 [Henneguya salminicola]|nr:hypothetical protein HZS_3729 [Henneguya salminicola]
MKRTCPNPSNITEFNQIVCDRIPKKNNRNGLTSKAPMYMKCGFHSNYSKYCYHTKCTNSSKLLKNCDSYSCKNMDVKFRFQTDQEYVLI